MYLGRESNKTNPEKGYGDEGGKKERTDLLSTLLTVVLVVDHPGIIPGNRDQSSVSSIYAFASRRMNCFQLVGWPF